MKSLGELSVELKKYPKELESRLIQAQKEAAEKIRQDIVDLAPIRTGNYAASIKISDIERDRGKITTIIYSDLKVGGEGKWKDVPLAAFLEWGTGKKGQDTNAYNHGYSYRQTPWVYYDEYLGQWVTTTGIVARPHFYPSLQKNITYYENKIKEAVQWKK